MKRLDLIALVVLGVIALTLILSLFKSTLVRVEGYTQKEVNYLLEIQSLKNDKKTLNYEIERFKDKIENLKDGFEIESIVVENGFETNPRDTKIGNDEKLKTVT